MVQLQSASIRGSVLLKDTTSVILLEILWRFAPSFVAAITLYASVTFFGESFNHYDATLLGAVLALCTLFMRPSRDISSQFNSPKVDLAFEITVRWLLVVFVLLLIGFLTRSTGFYTRRILMTWVFVTPVLAMMVSFSLLRGLRSLTRDDTARRRVLFAGCNETSVSLAAQIGANPHYGMSVAGFFEDRSAERLGNPAVKILGSLSNLVSYVRQSGTDVIFVALPIRHMQRVLQLLDELRDTTASIYYVPDISAFDLIQARTAHVGGIPVIAMCESPRFGLGKRLTDIVLSGAALLALAVPFTVISLLIRMSSPGPAIFRQRRCGLDGKEIIVYKFRSMTVVENGDEIRQAVRNDSRITPVGAFLRRFSLDELPQLFNVLQGQMSLVGPRPHAVAHNESYRRLIKGYMIRHKVLPGITGLAQISGFRGETRELAQMEARVRHDLEYLRSWTMALDFKILALTVLRMFRDNQAY
jgi:putative colanic acid biosysnthesis UDP-glucose lipid carrier transferase